MKADYHFCSLSCESNVISSSDSNANSNGGQVGLCRDFLEPGCTDSTKLGYNALATVDDGSCRDIIVGCMNPAATNYNSRATVAGTCAKVPNYGCTDSLAKNYESAAEAEHPNQILYGCK